MACFRRLLSQISRRAFSSSVGQSKSPNLVPSLLRRLPISEPKLSSPDLWPEYPTPKPDLAPDSPYECDITNPPSSATFSIRPPSPARILGPAELRGPIMGPADLKATILRPADGLLRLTASIPDPSDILRPSPEEVQVLTAPDPIPSGSFLQLLAVQSNSGWMLEKRDRFPRYPLRRPQYSFCLTTHLLRRADGTDEDPKSIRENFLDIPAFISRLGKVSLEDLHRCWPDLEFNWAERDLVWWEYLSRKHRSRLGFSEAQYFQTALTLYKNLEPRFTKLPANGKPHPLGTAFTAQQLRDAYPYRGYILTHQLKTGEIILKDVGVRHTLGGSLVLGRMYVILPRGCKFEDSVIIWPGTFKIDVSRVPPADVVFEGPDLLPPEFEQSKAA